MPCEYLIKKAVGYNIIKEKKRNKDAKPNYDVLQHVDDFNIGETNDLEGPKYQPKYVGLLKNQHICNIYVTSESVLVPMMNFERLSETVIEIMQGKISDDVNIAFHYLSQYQF